MNVESSCRKKSLLYLYHFLFFLISIQAVRDGREEVLRQWLGSQLSTKKKKILINAYDSFGFTAMHYAARFNRFKMMQLLIANEASKQRARGMEALFT